MILILASLFAIAEPPTITIDRDNVEITQSCFIEIGADHIVDADGNGVIHINTNNVVVDFKNQRLHGAAAAQLPDSFAGIGIKINAKNVTLRNANVSGYKVGIHATNADGLTIHSTDVSNNYHQRLKSTPAAEDSSDWLWPHSNDNDEWVKNYGAGIYVKQSHNITLHDIRARKTQNGIMLDRVTESRVFDCDCSFLSGWGLAMWRSDRNVIYRNAFDFCVRGYSHGVYNRGQDSAGILMFEQCNQNVVAENSVTHGGDGVFAFAGKEALGQVNMMLDIEWYRSRGCGENVFADNDLSYAAAHGLELTFSFNNIIWKNRFVGNAICGVWGGYSRDTQIADNHFESNGDMAYGRERGGINIEHGQRNVITGNNFVRNACAIYLWWDDDVELAKTPWAAINGVESDGNRIISNTFEQNAKTIELRQTTNTRIAPMEAQHVQQLVDADAQSLAAATILQGYLGGMPVMLPDLQPAFVGIPARSKPVGARAQLADRKHIIMTEWGPWDHESPLLQFVKRIDQGDEYRLLGAKSAPKTEQVKVQGDVRIEVKNNNIIVRSNAQNTITPYSLVLDIDGQPLTARGTLTGGNWDVRAFKSACDPREDVERWRREGMANHQALTAETFDFRFGSGGMTEARKLAAKLPRDHFGVIATRTLTFPTGTWRLRTTSDDGIRVWMDDELVVDDWTHHGPTRHDHEFTITDDKTVALRVEYFELDGYAVLSVEFERVE